MGRIIYKQGSVFEPSGVHGDVLVHSVNCQGVWGSGVAKEFKERFPGSFEAYRELCERAKNEEFSLVGFARTFGRVACLFTSEHYGYLVDPPVRIMQATHMAIAKLMFHSPRGMNFHSPRINAGLFKVPWEWTEVVIESALVAYPENSWTVWTP